MCGFIAQLVEHRTGIAEVTGSNPVEALIFFRLLISSCLNWKTHCDDHASLSSTTAVQIYELFRIYITSFHFSNRSDEGLTLETSAFESLYGGQFTLLAQLIKPNYLVTYQNNALLSNDLFSQNSNLPIPNSNLRGRR